jgi:hypothetical protein
VGEKTLADISRATCKEYCQHRGSDAAARRELEDLGSAINMAIKDGVCRHVVKVTVPKAPAKRTTFLELDQVAKLLWQAYRKRKTFKRQAYQKLPYPACKPLYHLRAVYWQPLGKNLASIVREGRRKALR